MTAAPTSAAEVARARAHRLARGDDRAGLAREWMVTNGLGGYAAGTLGGAATRRSHGLLIAALPAPLGRTLMLNALLEAVRLDDGTNIPLVTPDEVRLVNGRPRWRHAQGDVVIEKSILMPYRQNTSYVSYRLSPGSPSVVLTLEPAFDVRPHEGPVGGRRRRLHDGGGRAAASR